MTVTSKARPNRGYAAAAVLAAMLAAGGAGESWGQTSGQTPVQTFTLDELARMGGPLAADEFPLVLGHRYEVPEIRARYYEKHTFTIGDGSRHVMFVFRASNCWLREGAAMRRTVIDCRENDGPGVFIPILFVTPESRPHSRRPFGTDLVLTSRGRNSLANFMPARLLNRTPPYGSTRVIWIRLRDPEADSLTLSTPAAPAALVVCVPFAVPECLDNGRVRLTNLDDTPPDGMPLPRIAVAPPPAPPGPPIASPPPGGQPPLPPAAATLSPPPATAPPPRTATNAPPPTPAAPPTTAAPPAVAPPPPKPQGQLHFVVRPSAGSLLPDWPPERMAKRLVALLATTQNEFLVQTRDGSELQSSQPPELARSGDGVVVWSGERPDGPVDLVLHGDEGLELVPHTQSQPRTASSGLIGPRILSADAVASAEFRIAAPFLYDQWQASIEIMTKVYGQEQPDTADDLCQFSILIPRSGLLSLVTWPVSIDLDLTNQGGKRFLLSQPVILPSQLMRAGGEPLHLEIQPTAADKNCVSQTRKLAAFTTASGSATAAWKVSNLPESTSTGRIDIRPSSLMTRGRWLLGLYGPQNIAAGAEAGSRPAADAQDQVFSSFASFLDDFRERHFQRGRPESQAVGADLALIGSADSGAAAFSEKSVIVGKFRQPAPASDAFQIDPEGIRRLSAFMSGPGAAAEDVPFHTVGLTIRHYAQLFGEFSGQKPPVAVYVGSARPGAQSCREWKQMTAEVARLSGEPKVFGLVFADVGSGQIGRQLGQSGRGPEEALTPEIRGFTCEGVGDSPSLLFVSFPDLLTRPADVLRPAFSVLERWTGPAAQP